MMFRIALCAVLMLAACGRPMTTGEQAFAKTLLGDQFDPSKVRVAQFTTFDKITSTRPKRARVACRERIWPEPKTDTVTVSTAAFVAFNTIFMSRDLYLPDYLPQYPEKMNLAAGMLYAHEMTHVWQWQNRATTGYHPLKAASEHRPGADPYLLDISKSSRFLDFPFEQQGAIVEEYVCCRTLDPHGARTKRLYGMLSGAFPVDNLHQNLRSQNISLPWSGAQTQGICSA